MLLIGRNPKIENITGSISLNKLSQTHSLNKMNDLKFNNKNVKSTLSRYFSHEILLSGPLTSGN